MSEITGFSPDGEEMLINPVKEFLWAVEIDGIDVFLCQELETPEVEISEALHSAGSFDVKTPGRIKNGDLVLKMLIPAVTGENKLWLWLSQCQSYGPGNVAANFNGYAKTCIIKLKNPDKITTVARYSCVMWPKKFKLGDLKRLSSENLMKTVTFAAMQFQEMPL